jgi:uncharacterized membrane protein required for colicin V production
MHDKTTGVLIVLTFLGMVGIYVGAWMAYQKYQAYQAQFSSTGNSLGLLAGLLGGH